MNIFYSDNIDSNTIQLSKRESHHCMHVMRMKLNDIVQVLDGNGNRYTCEIINNKKVTTLDIIKKDYFSKKNFSTHIGISPTKSHDRIDWFVEKSVELGIDEISFIKTERTERKKINFNRINKIAISAMKQSGQYYLPRVNDLLPFDKIIEQAKEKELFIAHVDNLKEKLVTLYSPGKDSCTLIGPEGDFTSAEVDFARSNNFKSISLGDSILRTETAAVHCISLIRALNE